MLQIGRNEMTKVRCLGGLPEHMKIAYARLTRKFNEEVVGQTATKGEAYALSSRASTRNQDGSQVNARQKDRVANPYVYTARSELAVKTMCQYLPRLRAVMNRTDKSYVLGGDYSDSEDSEEDEVDGLDQKLGARCTETEVAVLLKEVNKEVACVRCIRRCIGLQPESLDVALARVTSHFNKNLKGKTAEKGERFTEQKSGVDEGSIEARETTEVIAAYKYEPRPQNSIESICRRIPVLKAVLDKKLVYTLEASDSDTEDPNVFVANYKADDND